MFKFKKQTWQRLKVASFAAIGGTMGIGLYQGLQLRENYVRSEKIQPPSGPMVGIEKFLDKIRDLKHEITDKINPSDKFREIKDEFHEVVKWDKNVTVKDNIKQISDRLRSKIFNYEHIIATRQGYEKETDQKKVAKKIKLLILGDSLVAGVGCDASSHPSSPVLPTILARMLSISLKADIEWKAVGIIGATVRDLRTLALPDLKNDFFSPSGDILIRGNEAETEYLVVVICGLNDWKSVFENFPYGYGPDGFRRELKGLIDDLTAGVKQKCHVYLPALPCSCGDTDPNYIFRRWPLSFLVNVFMYLWDNQKQAIAFDDESTTMFIGSPTSMDAEYATPGAGNVSADGVHPSTQGYTWWAMHIADVIAASRGVAFQAAIEGSNS